MSSLSRPGPYGYPVRFGVRHAGVKGFKIYGSDPSQPLRYIEWHTSHQVLHASGHKKDKSPALVTIRENWPSWSMPLDGDAAAFTITAHNANPSPDDGGDNNSKKPDMAIDMDHICCRPATFRFELPVTTTTPQADDTASTTTTTTLETFEWRRAPPTCRETRGIRRKALPVMQTGDERPPAEGFVYSGSGSVLVRTTNGPQRPPTPTTPLPLGFTPQGEEIVASYAPSHDRHAWYYFQFWGAAAAGGLGETFTHVAVMTGLAVYLDEEAAEGRLYSYYTRRRWSIRRWRKSEGSGEALLPRARSWQHHGLSLSLSGPALARRGPGQAAGWDGAGSWVGAGVSGRAGFHYAQHGGHPPGHSAAQCGMVM